jgi:hypothetical protein
MHTNYHHGDWVPTSDGKWEVTTETTLKPLPNSGDALATFMAVVAREKGRPPFAPAYTHGPYSGPTEALQHAEAAIHNWMAFYDEQAGIPEEMPVFD